MSSIIKQMGKYVLQASLIITLCTTTYFSEKTCATQKTAPTITIWVHGSKTLPTSLYRLTRFDMPLGLKKATELTEPHHPKLFIKTLCENNQLIDGEHVYLFGWPGDLDPSLRKSQAHILYDAIEQLLVEYKKTYGCTPAIRIIAHSHGGNLTLNLARVAQEHDTCSFTITELILLACPVWKANEPCIDHKIFEGVYHLYSNLDLMQRMDPQGRYDVSRALGDTPFFSGRTFKEHKKLIQVEIDCPFPMQHGLFLFRPFLPNLQRIKHLIDQESHNGTENIRIKIRWNPFTQWTDVRTV